MAAFSGSPALFAPGFDIEQTSYIVYGKTVHVKGKAIRIDPSVR